MNNDILNDSNFKLDRFFFYFLCSFPILLISGPFLPDLCLVLIILFFLIVITIRKEIYLLNNLFFKIFFIFYLYLTLNSIFISGEFLSIKSSGFYFRFGLFVIASTYLISKNKDKINYLFFILLITLFFLILDSTFQKIFGYNLVGLKMSHPIRVSSFFGDKLVLGSFVVKILPIIIALLHFSQFKKKQLLSLIIIIASFFPIIFSAEKAAIIIYVIFFFLFLLALNVSSLLKLFSALMLISLLATIFITNPDIKKRLIDQGISNSKGGYIFSRMHDSHYKTAYKMFIDKPLFGHGPKTFRIVCSDEKYKHNQFSCSTHPHNFYIQLLAETGLVGFMFLFIFYLIIFREFLRELLIFYVKKKIDYTKYFLLCSLLLLFLPIAPSGNFFNNWTALNYCFPLGLLFFFNPQMFKTK